MVNLNDEQTYKVILESLLGALSKHPDFVEISDLVERKMPANAASRVKEILAQQDAIREAADPSNYIDGMYLLPDSEDLIQIPEIGQQSRDQEGDLFFLIPDSLSESDDDDDFNVISY